MATRKITFNAIVHQEDEWWVAECTELRTVSQGRTVEEALKNLIEATELYLEAFGLPEELQSSLAEQKTKPLFTSFEAGYA